MEINSVIMLVKINGKGATRARIKNKIRPIIINKKMMFNPSLNNTKINPIKTNAVPGSGWIIIRNIGNAITKPIWSKDFIFFKLTWISLKIFDTAKAVVILANSEGWSPIPPMVYHEVAPDMFFPKIKSPIRDKIDSK